MTQDEIIQMARQAGIQDAYSNFPHKGVIAQLEAFAKLVAAKERRECAKVCAESGAWTLVHEIEARGEA